jgi:hypothetical protein
VHVIHNVEGLLLRQCPIAAVGERTDAVAKKRQTCEQLWREVGDTATLRSLLDAVDERQRAHLPYQRLSVDGEGGCRAVARLSSASAVMHTSATNISGSEHKTARATHAAVDDEAAGVNGHAAQARVSTQEKCADAAQPATSREAKHT